MMILYNILTWFLLILAWPLLALAALLLPKRRGVVFKRLGFQVIGGKKSSRQDGRPVWVHALSVGEVTSAVPLVRRLAEDMPERPVYVSATTRTGFEAAGRLLGRQAAAIFYFPFDFSWAVKRVADQVDPVLVVLVESDIWPNFLRVMGKRKVPVILANGRLSDRAGRGYKRLAWLMRPTLRRFAVICAQTKDDAERFVALGLDPATVITTGNLKFDQPLEPISPQQQQDMKSSLNIPAQAGIIVAGSTHPGEEEIIAAAWLDINRNFDRTFLIIAPRDPSRAEQVRTIFQDRGAPAGTMTTRKNRAAPVSLPNDSPDNSPEDYPEDEKVIVVDTIGHLKTLYALADVALIGGSLVEFRGHNPLEAAAQAKPILFGPHMEDFREIAAGLIEAGGARQINDGQELGQAIAELFNHRWLADATGRAAFDVFVASGGATEKVVAISREQVRSSRPTAPPDQHHCWQTALLLLSWLYGAAALLRRKLYDHNLLKPRRLTVPVISIGNLTAGGTGKTPMTVLVAGLLKKRGLSPVIVSRGYRGSASRRSGIVSDGRHLLMDARQSGDEPFLMAGQLPDVPVLVGQNRYRIAAEAIQRFSPDVILLDDGLQHFQLARDIDIVLLDKARPLDNGRLLPAGMLREPPATLRQADIIVFTRADASLLFPESSVRLEAYLNRKPRFDTRHLPFIAKWTAGRSGPDKNLQSLGIDALSPYRAVVFCGLANNHSFLESVRRLTAAVCGYRFFRDHHDYTPADLTAISRLAQTKQADLIVTSQKDYVRFAPQQTPDFPCDLVVLDVAVSFGDQAARFDELLWSLLNRQQASPDK